MASVVLFGVGLLPQSRGVTIDFEGIAPEGGQEGAHHTRAFGDFSVYIGHGHYYDSAYPEVLNGNRVNNGTDYLITDVATTVRINRTNWQGFSFSSVDLGLYFGDIPGTHRRLKIEGISSGGGIELNIDVTAGAALAFQTYSLSGFENVTEIYFTDLSGGFAYDNILLGPAISAPETGSTAALFTLGIAALAISRRKDG